MLDGLQTPRLPPCVIGNHCVNLDGTSTKPSRVLMKLEDTGYGERGEPASS